MLYSSSAIAEDNTANVEMATLKIRVLEQIPGQEAPLVLSQPMIMSLIDRPLGMDVTHSVDSAFDPSQHDVGLKFVAHIKKHDDKKYELNLQWFRGKQIREAEAPDTEYFVEEKLSARTTLKSGDPKKLRVSATRWYEVTVFGPNETPRPTSHNTPRPTPVPRTIPRNAESSHAADR